MRAMLLDHSHRENRQSFARLDNACDFRKGDFRQLKHRTPPNPNWSDGILEQWNAGIETSIPPFHYSILWLLDRSIFASPAFYRSPAPQSKPNSLSLTLRVI
jgi:hypothetical protein